MDGWIFKIVGRGEWAEAEAAGLYRGSPDDRRDGFIHFSTAAQARGTAAKHFAGRDDLLLIGFPADALGDALKWEASRGGASFPHLYAVLPVAAVGRVWLLALGRDGVHRFPDGFAGDGA